MAAEEGADTSVTSPLTTSGGTSSGTETFPEVRLGAEVEVRVQEDLGRFVKAVITVVDTEHFQLNKGNARAMLGTME